MSIDKDRVLLRESLSSRDAYVSVFEAHPDAIYVLDAEGYIQHCNSKTYKMFGYEHEEMANARIGFVTSNESKHLVREAFERALIGAPQEIEVLPAHTKQGSRIYIHLTYVPAIVEGQVAGVYGFSRDITKQIQAEDQVNIKQSLMDQGQYVGEFGVCEYRPASDTLICSEHFLSILGFPVGYPLMSQEYYELIHPEDRDNVVTAKAGVRQFAENIFRIIRPDGNVRWLHTRWEQCNHNGERMFFGAIKDITQRRIMDQNLKLSQEFIAQANSIARIGNWCWDLETDEIDWSDEVMQICGVSEDFREGLKFPQFSKLVLAEDEDVFRSFLSNACTNRSLAQECEFRIESPIDGSVKYLHTFGKAINNPIGHEIMIGTVQEITDRKTNEQRLRQAEKLSIVGQLAAGVTHEIRNPLATIKGFLQLLASVQCEPQKQKEYYKIMSDGINHIEFITGEMLALAKPHISKVVRVAIDSTLNEVVKLLNAEARLHRTRINFNVEAKETSVMCDVNQIKQVFVNIIKNAIDAMGAGGTLDITVSNGPDVVSIQFKDKGCGIPPNEIKKLGQPFYTTKEKGTGLGIMVSNKILHEHHGRLSITSILGKGTSVTVYLPLAS